MFMKPPADDALPSRGVDARLTGGVVAVAAVLLLFLGVYPSPAVRWARASTMPMSPARAVAAPTPMQALAPVDSQPMLP